MPKKGIDTKSLRLEAHYLVSVQTAVEDAARLMSEVTRLTPLLIGRYDCNVFQSGAGTEHYRPREGAAAGAEDEVRHRPGVVELSFQLPKDDELLGRVAEAIYQVHGYQEPVIVVSEVLASRTKGLDDRDNPHRWWNSTGDWKRAAPPHE